MGNQNEIIYIPGSKRFKGNSDKELFIQVPFKSTQQNYTQGDRTVLLSHFRDLMKRDKIVIE